MKKTNFFVAVVLLVTLVVFGIIFRKQIAQKMAGLPGVDNAQKADQGAFDNLPKTDCRVAEGEDILSKAVSNQDPQYCTCLDLDTAQSSCTGITMDSIYYQQALNQYDERLCSKISSPDNQELCKKSVAEAAKYLAGTDPAFLGNIYMISGRYDDSIKVFDSVAQEKKGNSDALISLAIAYANKALAEHQEEALIPKALVLTDQAKAISPDDPEVYRVTGYVYEVKPDLGMAEENYNKALELDDKYILAYLGRGHVLSMMGKPGRALEDFNRAKELDADKAYPDIYSNLCRLHMAGPDTESAIEACLANAEIAPSTLKGQAMGMLAELYLRAGRIDEAVVRIKTALAYSSNDPAIHVSAAKIYNTKGNFDMATFHAQQSLKLDNRRALAYAQLAYAQMRQDKLAEAAENGEKGFALVDKDPSILATAKKVAKAEAAGLLADIYKAGGHSDLEKKYRDLAAENQ